MVGEGIISCRPLNSTPIDRLFTDLLLCLKNAISKSDARHARRARYNEVWGLKAPTFTSQTCIAAQERQNCTTLECGGSYLAARSLFIAVSIGELRQVWLLCVWLKT